MAALVCAQLLFLDAEKPKKEIALYINSPGGIVTAGMAIYDTMQFIRRPFRRSASARPHRWARFCSPPAHKGTRFATPNSRIMVHQPSGGFQGQASDIERHARDILKMKHRLNEIYVKHTGRTYEEVERALDRDNFMTSEEAQDWGVIDRSSPRASKVRAETSLKRKNPVIFPVLDKIVMDRDFAERGVSVKDAY